MATKSAAEEQALLIARATEEREKLFQRYDRGREAGAEIDPWEDPGWEVYHQTDRYGFIHDKRLPQKPNPNEQKAREIELERVKKWLKMLDKWTARDTQEKVRRRVFKGIPDKLRSKVWMRLLNLEQAMAGQTGVYQRMLRLARTWGTEARQIDSDVNRQFREHLFYRERYSIKQRSLFNVLTAYSMYNMEVGYCQGMAGVAGVLLMYMDEEEAFWALSTLLADKKYALHGLYIEGFPKLTRFLAHHDKIITRFLPKLKKHFDQCNLDSILYSLKWFFVIFIERIPFSLCLRVWDIFLLDGDRVITAMAYTILRLHRSRILKLRDMDAIVQYIQVQLYKDFGFDEDHVVRALEQSVEELRRAKLEVAPPPGESELPKGPFGVFKEPSFESQIGRRKSLFTEQEKQVTETVKLKREKTEQEIQVEINNNNNNSNNEGSTKLPGAVMGGSNGHLNSALEIPTIRYPIPKSVSVHIVYSKESLLEDALPISIHMAESEDGGSMLGSSRKSLADTSVTSTADLSIFSGGQRSQHTFDEDGHTINNSIHSNILYDPEELVVNNNLISNSNNDPVGEDDDEEEEESSPGSAYGSFSVINRPPSTMRITPTPRALSPQDIVRIYVPPPPPEELLYERPTELRLNNVSSEGRSPESDCRTIIQRTPTELPGSVSTATITSQSMRSLNQQQLHYSDGRRSRDGSVSTPGPGGLESTLRDLALYSSQNSLRGHPGSTSSSRRGSMSRKSSVIVESELANECPHIRVTTSGRDSRKSSLTHRHSYGDAAGSINVEYEAILAKANSNKVKKEPRIMTSFEKLAQMNDTFYFGGSAMSQVPGAAGENNGNGATTAVGGTPRKHQQSDDEASFSYSFQAMRTSGGVADPVRSRGRNGAVAREERTKCTSDYNIQYKAREELGSSVGRGEVSNGRGNGQTEGGHHHHGSDVKEMMKNKKQYDRFFTPDESEEDEDEGGVEVEQGSKKRPPPGHKANKTAVTGGGGDLSSPSSSSGGASKSLLVTTTTPVNETQPLIMDESGGGGGDLDGGGMQYNFRHSRGVEQHSSSSRGRRVKHQHQLSTEEDEDGYDDEETDYGVDEGVGKGTPASSPTYGGGGGGGKSRGGSYFAHRSSSYIPITEDVDGVENGGLMMMRSYHGGELQQQQPPVIRGGGDRRGGSPPVDMANKIRIRVNEKSK